jgi:hypothetical protein
MSALANAMLQECRVLAPMPCTNNLRLSAFAAIESLAARTQQVARFLN